jgi:hypothetical protein
MLSKLLGTSKPGDDIKQNAMVVGPGGATYQISGDYHQGLSYTEVKDLMEQLLEANFPKIQADVEAKSRAYVDELVQGTVIRLNGKVGRISPEKLAEPDVQATFNDAVQSVARKGEKAHIDMLAELLGMLVERDNSDFVDICIEEAVAIVPKLTAEMLCAMAVIQFTKHLTIKDETSLESFYEVLYHQYASKCGQITLTKLMTIASFGAGTYTNIMGQNTFDEFRKKYSIINTFADPEASFTETKKTLSIYDERQLHKLELNGPGRIIALTFLQRSFPSLDPKNLLD